MPPYGGTRTSLSVGTTFTLTGPAGRAFQPNGGVFSPGLPLAPVAGQQPTRLIDFPVGVNTVITPRGGYGDIHSFASLRAYANVEPVRLAIETCKDQVERLDWKIKAVDGKNGPKASDARIKELTKFFRKPDGVTPFATWLRRSLEDLLVIDAPAFEKRRDRGGKLIGLDIVPGDTIKLLVDETGRRPLAPVPAFQQVIKGMVWADLTTDDLIYSPRNPRPEKLYGFSPVEQIIVTLNTVMRRQAMQLAYFTEGNTPAGILNTPAGWGPDTIQTMQDAWDARMEGNLPGKSKAMWVPADTKYQPLKDSPLKDEFDEWLYRIVCFAFSLPPTAFIKQMNRATAQQGSDTGKEEGIESRKLWWSRIANDIIQEEFGYDDLEWGWNEDIEVDALKQATIDDTNLKNGSTTIDEVRDGRGLDVLPEKAGANAMIYLPTGPVLVSKVVEEALNPPEPAPIPPALAAHVAGQTPGEEGENPQSATQGEQGSEQPHTPNVALPKTTNKLAKAASPSFERPLARRAIASAKRTIARGLKVSGDDVAAQVEDHLKRFGKAADDSTIGPELAAQVASQLDLDSLADIDITDDLFSVAYDSAEKGLAQVGVTSNDQLTGQVNRRAADFAKRRAGELVSAQGPQNIVAATRDMVRTVIADGLANNIGSAAIAEKVQESTAFSSERSALIAETEIRGANSQGALAGYKTARDIGVNVKKLWSTAGDEDVDEDICQANEDQGPIDLDDDFQSGDDATPGHPRCRCSLVPVVEDGDPDRDAETDADEA